MTEPTLPLPELDRITAPNSGASVQPVYTKRSMTMYAINDTEVATLSTMNMQATIYFTVASFLASSAIGIYTNGVFYERLTPAGQVAQYYVAPALIILTVAAISLGIMNILGRRRLWRDIRKGSL